MTKYYPVNLNLKGKKCLVIGGGKVAERKARRLLSAGAIVKLISPKIARNLYNNNIILIKREASLKDIDKAFLVICASDDRALNSIIARRCKRKGILVNVVDSPEECSFTLPSVISRGALTISISTDGISPGLSKRLRQDLEKRFGPEYAVLLRAMKKLRPKIMKKFRTQKQRKAFWQSYISQRFV